MTGKYNPAELSDRLLRQANYALDQTNHNETSALLLEAADALKNIAGTRALIFEEAAQVADGTLVNGRLIGYDAGAEDARARLIAERLRSRANPTNSDEVQS